MQYQLVKHEIEKKPKDINSFLHSSKQIEESKYKIVLYYEYTSFFFFF